MRAVLPALLVLAVLLPAPSLAVQAEAACSEPCGYIIPIIDLDFPEKMLCGGSGLIFTGSAGDDCQPVPEDGAPLTLEGTLTWYYDASEEPPYPKQANEDIVISFSGTRNNPEWLEMEVLPGEMRITDVDLAHPDHFQTEENSQGGQTLWFRFVQDVSVTFTKLREPTDAEVARILERDGVLQVFLKAKSTESSSTYRESFGVEEFRFKLSDEDVQDAEEDVGDNEAPGVALPLLVLAALGAAGVRRRRA